MIAIHAFEGRDVAVFGLARTGLAAAKALRAGGARVHAWDDSPEARARAEAEGVELSDINARDWRDFAALVLSPGVPLHFPKPHRVVELARAVGVPIIGDIELFALEVSALPPQARPKIIGVTGTNGKSTTTALIGHILKHAGRDAVIGGNIGTAVLELADLHAGAHFVLELSSYQLDLVQSLRCDVAVFLNLTPDHLDRHGTLENYLAAKARIFANQGAGDWAVIGVDSVETAVLCTQLMGKAAAKVAPISNLQALGRGVSVLADHLYDALDARAERAASLAKAEALKGRHNAQNAAAAYAACRALGLAPREIQEGLETFPGLAHRMEKVATIAGVAFINDSKATNADAAAQALVVYPHARWIAGGVAKAGGIESLARFFPALPKAYLIGEAAPAFRDFMAGRLAASVYTELAAAVSEALLDAKRSGRAGEVVLFSPACASFDQFKDFEARGEAFRAIVLNLKAQLERASA